MSSRGGGIVASNGKTAEYPLVSAACDVSVIDVNAHAKLSQTYISTSEKAQDVKYVFPLPADAAICAFSAVIDGTRAVTGVVKERQQAQRDYDKAVSSGKTAALFQQHTSQVFEVSLGNLQPKQTIVVQIKFVSIIAHSGTLDSLRLRLPVTVAPFYGTPPDALLAITGAPPSRSVFELAASFQMTGKITSITSDTHPVTLKLGSISSDSDSAEFNPTRAHVSLTSDTMLKDDIVLELRCAGLDAPRCSVHRYPGPGPDEVTDALSLTLVPRFPAVPLPSQEYIFLVDRSGSMGGRRIEAVRNALQIMLRSLPSKRSTFNVFSFGSKCTSLWPQSVEYSKDSVELASNHVDAMRADYGGTETKMALQAIFESRQEKTAEPAAVFVLTDGEAWDLEGVFKTVTDAVAKSDKALRVFVLGVGNQVSHEMCDGIARAGRGVATYVREQEKPDAKLVGLLKAARSALVQDVSVDWGVPRDLGDEFEVVDATPPPPALSTVAAPVSLFEPSAEEASGEEALGPLDEQVVLPPFPWLQQAPTQLDALPPLYPGFRCSIFALIRQPRDAPLPTKVAIRGTMLQVPAVLDVPVVAADADTGAKAPLLHVLAARALVQSVEDAATSSAGPLSALTKAKIARLGTTYGIASSQTSFVAIDETGEPMPLSQSSSTPGTQFDQDVAEESDDEMGFALMDDGYSQTVASAEESGDEMGFGLFDDDDGGGGGNVPVSRARVFVEAEASVHPTVHSAVSVASIARQQQFDGSFPDADAFVLEELKLADVPALPKTLQGDGPLKAVWHTVLALAYFLKHFTSAEEQEAWSFLADKAREFVVEGLAEAGISDAEKVLDELLVQALAVV